MTTFDDRERAFENKFAHDEEMKFRAEALRNKLLALWAADLLGKTGDDALAYAGDVTRVAVGKAGDDDIVLKVSTDLGDQSSDAEVRQKLDDMLLVAKGKILEEF